MATSSLLKKLQKSTKIKEADILVDSKLFEEKDMTVTPVPAINIALSGDIDGGLRAGITTISGESRSFKTLTSLIMCAAYMKKYPDAIMLFYDSEFGSPQDYFKANGIDTSRVLHIPVTNIEELKFDLMAKLDNANEDGIKRGDRVIILVDSIGNLSSSKEANDAITENGATDMGGRAKSLKSFYRIVTPHLTLKNIPMLLIAHVYKEMALYPKTIVSGGQGGILASDTIWIITRSQEKEGTDLVGYNFNINVEKSRYVREKSKIPLLVTFEGGVSKYTGILELALDAKEVGKPANGWYQLIDPATGEMIGQKVRAKDTGTEDFLGVVLKRPTFKKWVSDNFKLAQIKMLEDDVHSVEVTE